MKSRITRQLGSCILALTMMLCFCPTMTVFAADTSSLSISETGKGSIDEGYTANVTIPTNNGTPFKVYSVYFNGGSFTVPATTSGTFSNGVYGNYATDISNELTSVQYTVTGDASVENIIADLSGIIYKGAGTVTISAAQYAPADGDAYYNGHYYRLSSGSDTWYNSMQTMLQGDTSAYEGYKGHPVTVTSEDENNMLINMLNRSNGRIWLGAVPSDSTTFADNGLPNAGYTSGARGGDGTGWSWIWGTPEAGKTVVSGTQFWSNVQPDGDSNTPSYIVYIGFESSTKWDDLSADHALNYRNLGSSSYVTEYSPWDGTDWVYDAEGNSATSGFDKAQSVSKTYDSSNVGTAQADAQINYSGEVLTGLEPNAAYIIIIDNTNYPVTADENGNIPLATSSYSLFGKNVTLARDGYLAQSFTIASRPTAGDLEAVAGETDITVTAVSGYEYSIDGTTWVRDDDGDGKVVFDGLTVNTSYTIYYRIASTESSFVSEIKTTDLKTLGSTAAISPKTGDCSTLLWALLLLVSSCTVTTLLVVKREK